MHVLYWFFLTILPELCFFGKLHCTTSLRTSASLTWDKKCYASLSLCSQMGFVPWAYMDYLFFHWWRCWLVKNNKSGWLKTPWQSSKRCFMPREYFLTGLLSQDRFSYFFNCSIIICSDAICFIDERISRFLRPLYVSWRSAGFSRSRPTLGGEIYIIPELLFLQEIYPW